MENLRFLNRTPNSAGCARLASDELSGPAVGSGLTRNPAAGRPSVLCYHIADVRTRICIQLLAIFPATIGRYTSCIVLFFFRFPLGLFSIIPDLNCLSSLRSRKAIHGHVIESNQTRLKI